MTVAANQKNTYNSSANARDITDVVTNISPQGAPFYNLIGQSVSGSRFKEFVTDSDADAVTTNGAIEGDTFTNTALTARPIHGNWCQIFRKVIEVSETQEAVDKYGGVKSEVDFQTRKAMREIAKDIEYTLICGASASGTTATARLMDGLTALVTTATCATASSATDWSATAAASISAFEEKLNDLFDIMFETGEDPTHLLVGGNRKRRISKLTDNVTRNIMASEKKQINTISVYESDFGMVKIVLDRYVPDAYIIAVNIAYFKTAYLRRIKPVPLAKIADSTRVALVGEATLEMRNALAVGVLASD